MSLLNLITHIIIKDTNKKKMVSTCKGKYFIFLVKKIVHDKSTTKKILARNNNLKLMVNLAK